MSVLTGAVAPCRLLSGVIADRIDKRRLFIKFALLHLFAMVWLSVAVDPWMFFVFAALYGMAYGGIDPPVVSLVGDAFGTANIGSLMGLMMVAWGLGAAAGPYLGGVVFDHTGTYNLAFIAAGMAMACAAACGIRLKL